MHGPRVRCAGRHWCLCSPDALGDTGLGSGSGPEDPGPQPGPRSALLGHPRALALPRGQQVARTGAKSLGPQAPGSRTPTQRSLIPPVTLEKGPPQPWLPALKTQVLAPRTQLREQGCRQGAPPPGPPPILPPAASLEMTPFPSCPAPVRLRAVLLATQGSVPWLSRPATGRHPRLQGGARWRQRGPTPGGLCRLSPAWGHWGHHVSSHVPHSL